MQCMKTNMEQFFWYIGERQSLWSQLYREKESSLKGKLKITLWVNNIPIKETNNSVLIKLKG